MPYRIAAPPPPERRASRPWRRYPALAAVLGVVVFVASRFIAGSVSLLHLMIGAPTTIDRDLALKNDCGGDIVERLMGPFNPAKPCDDAGARRGLP